MGARDVAQSSPIARRRRQISMCRAKGPFGYLIPWWSTWALIGWSLAIGVHGLVVRLARPRSSTSAWEERQINKFFERKVVRAIRWPNELASQLDSTITMSDDERPNVSGAYISSALVGGTTKVPGVVARAT